MAVAQKEMGRMFSGLADRYELFNCFTSLGLDYWWRNQLKKQILRANDILDLGTGTGDLIARLPRSQEAKKKISSERRVGVDLSPDMLFKASTLWQDRNIEWVRSSGAGLPFESDVFDATVSAFVMRNLQRGDVLPATLKECFRVLRPGGKLVFLDLTRPKSFLLRQGHQLYLSTIIPFWGRLLFGEKWPGAYLKTSIEALLPSNKILDLLDSVGFQSTVVKPLSGGIVSLFIGRKP